MGGIHAGVLGFRVLPPLVCALASSCGKNDAEPSGGVRTDELLSADWRFVRSDASGAERPDFDDASEPWQAATVPHTWNALDGQDHG